MKALIYVKLKTGVLDPQGEAIHKVSTTLGYKTIAKICQGKCFEVEFAADVSFEVANFEVQKLAKEILSNPIVEEYSVEFIRPSFDQTAKSTKKT